jgi:UDP-N-acetyl-D-glucosamine dehydrogenase
MKTLNYTARFIELASEINTNMPRYVVSRIQDAPQPLQEAPQWQQSAHPWCRLQAQHQRYARIPAIDIIHLLREKGTIVTYYDPFVPELDHDNIHMSSEKELLASVENADLVAIINNHSKVDYNMVVEKAQLVFDARNATKDIPKANLKVIKLC